ncbi:MAG TPA: hypothetical protein VHJ77_09610 [Vicinamibacterales bacterium]|jgi:hypothetical protein|nr:hypothetical protein [Vicinamibacterales bacterium]
MPTSMLAVLAVPALRIEPDVSVPTATATRFAGTAMPEPELDPPGVSSGRPSPPAVVAGRTD